MNPGAPTPPMHNTRPATSQAARLRTLVEQTHQHGHDRSPAATSAASIR